MTRDLVLIVEEPFVPGTHDSGQDIHREYQAGSFEDPERMLADKYHDFTLPACLTTLKSTGAVCTLYWARERDSRNKGGRQFNSDTDPISQAICP